MNIFCEECQGGFVPSSRAVPSIFCYYILCDIEGQYHSSLSTERVGCAVSKCSNCTKIQETCDVCSDGYQLVENQCCKFPTLKILAKQ